MPDTEQELEAKRRLHDTPITEAEAEKALEPLKEDNTPVKDEARQQAAEVDRTIQALESSKENLVVEPERIEHLKDTLEDKKVREKYENDLDRIVKALEYYKNELSRLWENQDSQTYETTSAEMRHFHDAVESTFKSIPDSIRNFPTEEEINEQFSKLLEEDEDHIQGFHGAKEAQNIQQVLRAESKTLAPSPEASEETREKVKKKIVLDSEFEALKKAFERLAEKGTPTDEQVRLLHEGMDDIRTRLGQGEDTKDLQDKLSALENKYPVHIPVDLTSVRTLARQVKAQYASIQHRLAPDQRRAFRSRIARLSGMVRQIEDERWHELVGHQVKNPKREYLNGERHINASLVMAIIRARKIAPALADLALAKKD